MTVDAGALEKLSLRAGHHGHDVVPFISPLAAALDKVGFHVEPLLSRMRMRMNGRTYMATAHTVRGRLIATFAERLRRGGPAVPAFEVDMTDLNERLQKAKTTAAYDAVLAEVRAIAQRLKAHADRPHP